jgi:hypothetical protein
MRLCVVWGFVLAAFGVALPVNADEALLSIAVFEADVTPPLGAPLCDGAVPPAKEIVDRLLARGIVILTDDRPIVLCAFDWVGIGNTGYDDFRERLAGAAGTTADRVALHCLHQHDAPGCDFLADELLAAHGLGNRLFDVAFARQAIENTAKAIQASLDKPRVVTHLGHGIGRVEKVASNRRVMGPDGKVKAIRWSSVKDPALHAEPEGTIDPDVQLVSFWDGETPIATISYYATHPQSYYAQGGVSCDFPGLARGLRDADQPGVAHLHFNGAGGNITAGKYNDGSPENRPILAKRLADGMKRAFENTRKVPIRRTDVKWQTHPCALPVAADLSIDALRRTIANENDNVTNRLRAARRLAWGQRRAAGHKIDVTCLRLGALAVVHMPGELFVEYQLAARKMRPGSPVMMAAYGDYAPGYIGLKESYPQGGYETGPASLVAPDVEAPLMEALRALLK